MLCRSDISLPGRHASTKLTRGISHPRGISAHQRSRTTSRRPRHNTTRTGTWRPISPQHRINGWVVDRVAESGGGLLCDPAVAQRLAALGSHPRNISIVQLNNLLIPDPLTLSLRPTRRQRVAHGWLVDRVAESAGGLSCDPAVNQRLPALGSHPRNISIVQRNNRLVPGLQVTWRCRPISPQHRSNGSLVDRVAESVGGLLCDRSVNQRLAALGSHPRNISIVELNNLLIPGPLTISFRPTRRQRVAHGWLVDRVAESGGGLLCDRSVTQRLPALGSHPRNISIVQLNNLLVPGLQLFGAEPEQSLGTCVGNSELVGLCSRRGRC